MVSHLRKMILIYIYLIYMIFTVLYHELSILGLVSTRLIDLSYNNLDTIDNKTHALLEDCLSLEKVETVSRTECVLQTANDGNYFAFRSTSVTIGFHTSPGKHSPIACGPRTGWPR